MKFIMKCHNMLLPTYPLSQSVCYPFDYNDTNIVEDKS